MEKIKVNYQASPGRYIAETVDWMMAVVPIYDEDGTHIDDVELYAEMVNETWNEEDQAYDDELATYDELMAEIIEQAREHGIDVSRLQFHCDSILYNQSQLAKAIGVSRAAITGRMRRGTLRGDYFTADGKPLFTHETVQRLKDEKYEEEQKNRKPGPFDPAGRG